MAKERRKKSNEGLKQKAPPPVADINVTPMVDVMLVLLIIFMVITPMLSKGKDVDKVKARNPIPMQAADKSDAVLIAVTRDGGTYLGNDKVPPDQLAPKVKDMLTNRVDKECFLKADQRAKYEIVLQVVQNLQAAGVDQLGLLTDQLMDARGRAVTGTKSAAP
ncbi:MAG: biopolymer transporter ExbD [Bryobacteraceae bacterium]|jgi:biopolymer transport protein ExbD/biopolymer transport protein TolR